MRFFLINHSANKESMTFQVTNKKFYCDLDHEHDCHDRHTSIGRAKEIEIPINTISPVHRVG